MHVPLHFTNEDTCVGVKVGGGVISHAINDIEVNCLPKDLPEYIEVDMLEVNVGENLHLSNLVLPKGVESVALSHGEDHDLLVSAVNAPRGVSEDDDDDAEAAPAEDAAEDDKE